MTGWFSNYNPAEVERDKGGQPLIITPDGTTRAYTRASGLGDYVTDGDFLVEWKLTNLAIALGQRPDLADMCATEPYTTGFDEPAPHIKSASKKRVMGIVNRLLDAVRIDERADRGTVVHAVTETDYPGYVPLKTIGELAAFKRCLVKNKIVRLGSEMFTVNDRLRVAGTFDHLMYSPELGIFIGDTKNGRNKNNLGFSIQFANYANSVLYTWNEVTDQWERTTLEEYVESRFPEIWEAAGKTINREVAVLFSVKDGECKTSEVDIEWGYEMAGLAAAVRDARGSEAGKVKMSKRVVKVAGKEAKEALEGGLLEWIETCPSVEMLRLLWAEYKDDWSPALTNAAAERKAVLAS